MVVLFLNSTLVVTLFQDLLLKRGGGANFEFLDTDAHCDYSVLFFILPFQQIRAYYGGGAFLKFLVLL